MSDAHLTLTGAPAPVAGDRRSCARTWLTYLLSVISSIALLTLGETIAATPAHADGDPASDVLATQSLFLPWDTDVPTVQQARLSSLLVRAERDGHPLRVALIASPSDLGSVGALWRQPQSYAEFLAQELSLLYRGPLLIVMPNGFGVTHAGLSPAAVRSALSGIPLPRTGAQLAEETITAVQRLSDVSGHPLAVPASSANMTPTTSSHDGGAWIAFALGSVLIALAWTASLRAQPLGWTRKTG